MEQRPFCVFCFTALSTLLAAACLPQAALGLLAAFCVAGVLACAVRRQKRWLFLPAGAALGLALLAHTVLFQQNPAQRFAGTTAAVTARVLSVGRSYLEDSVSAELELLTLNGKEVRLKLSTPCMPQCEMGELIEGCFELSAPGGADRLSLAADGIFLMGEYESDHRSLGMSLTLPLRLRRAGYAMSVALRKGLTAETGGVLAAMVAGDRRFVPKSLSLIYRRAGIPHVLVISGMHVALLCNLFRTRRKREYSRRRALLSAAATGLTALLFMAITGFTPSVRRAGLALIAMQLASVLLQPGDAVTTLGAVGLCMMLSNAYAICGVGLQLSFTATLGVLLGSETQHSLEKKREKRMAAALAASRKAAHTKTAGAPRLKSGKHSAGKAPVPRGGLAFAACDAALKLVGALLPGLGASLAVFPVLVLQGMNVSAVSLLTNLLVGVLLRPMLLAGLAGACLGCVPGIGMPLAAPFKTFAAVLVRGMNASATFCAALPGAQLYFETAYPALAFLAVAAALYALHRTGCGKRWLAGCAVLLAAAAFAFSALYSAGVAHVALVGNTWSPAVVLTQNGSAAVLLRGGSYNAAEVQAYLERRGIGEIDVLVDLRIRPETACLLKARQNIVLSAQEKLQPTRIRWQDACLEVYFSGNGGVVLAGWPGGLRMAVTSGKAEAAADIPVTMLLGASSKPGPVKPETVLALSKSYPWLDSTDAKKVYYGQPGLGVLLRPGGEYRITGAEG